MLCRKSHWKWNKYLHWSFWLISSLLTDPVLFIYSFYEMSVLDIKLNVLFLRLIFCVCFMFAMNHTHFFYTHGLRAKMVIRWNAVFFITHMLICGLVGQKQGWHVKRQNSTLVRKLLRNMRFFLLTLFPSYWCHY